MCMKITMILCPRDIFQDIRVSLRNLRTFMANLHNSFRERQDVSVFWVGMRIIAGTMCFLLRSSKISWWLSSQLKKAKTATIKSKFTTQMISLSLRNFQTELIKNFLMEITGQTISCVATNRLCYTTKKLPNCLQINQRAWRFWLIQMCQLPLV